MEFRHIARITPRALGLGLALSLAVPLSLAACTDAAVDAKAAHDMGRGTVRVFDATPQEVWTASHAVMKWNPVGNIVDHPAENYFVTDPTDHDEIGVWVEPVSATQTRVSVVVMDDPTLPGPNEQGIVKDIATAISLERSGQPLEKRPQ